MHSRCVSALAFILIAIHSPSHSAHAQAVSTQALSQQPAPVYDVVIRNGRVLDGMGNPWIRADVAIKDGKFAKIGVIAERGRTEIDAKGKYVSPGWIDMMDQSGATLPRNGLAENKLQEGVTTAIGGEGGTPVPAGRVGEFFATLERQGISINFGSYFSETQARVAVLGQSARKPNAAELERMRAIVDTAMRGGAMGMTTALIYPPSSYATTDELVEVAKAAAKYGGVYASHIRDEGKGVVGAVNEAIAIGERAGMPVEIFHFEGCRPCELGVFAWILCDRRLMQRVRVVLMLRRIFTCTLRGEPDLKQPFPVGHSKVVTIH